MRTVYINGNYFRESEAKVSIFDRGYLFSDGVYEVTSILESKLIDFPSHMQRLDRSMKELKMEAIIDHEELYKVHKELIRVNNLEEGLIYLQITRGVADRNFAFPDPKTEPTIIAFTQAKPLIASPLAVKGMAIITVDDLRWHRCDIKTIQLLYPSIAKNEALRSNADDAWMVRNGIVTEGTSHNAWIVKNQTIITRQTDTLILSGITRSAVLKCAHELDYRVEMRPFTVAEAKAADEAFITSATNLVTPVVSIDGSVIKDGKVGEFTKKLREEYISQSLKFAT